jgi:hypothetical protein
MPATIGLEQLHSPNLGKFLLVFALSPGFGFSDGSPDIHRDVTRPFYNILDDAA